jgi:hypothetical protein
MGSWCLVTWVHSWSQPTSSLGNLSKCNFPGLWKTLAGPTHHRVVERIKCLAQCWMIIVAFNVLHNKIKWVFDEKNAYQVFITEPDTILSTQQILGNGITSQSHTSTHGTIVCWVLTRHQDRCFSLESPSLGSACSQANRWMCSQINVVRQGWASEAHRSNPYQLSYGSWVKNSFYIFKCLWKNKMKKNISWHIKSVWSPNFSVHN